ncbi:hypothetical protein BGZ94_007384 [Podila epigama]|nr:hypothetical protein BGZ94_007384 [Podila epigama]
MSQHRSHDNQRHVTQDQNQEGHQPFAEERQSLLHPQPHRSPSASPKYQAIDKTNNSTTPPLPSPSPLASGGLANTVAGTSTSYDSGSDSPSDTDIDSQATTSALTRIGRTGHRNKNRNNPHDEAQTPLVQQQYHPGSTSANSEETLLETGTSAAASIHLDEHSREQQERLHHQKARRRWIMKLMAFVAQLGLLIYFGGLIIALFKAEWVYPYSWHPILMGLYGFVATEVLSIVLNYLKDTSPRAILILQPIEKAAPKRLARTIHGVVQILALVFSLGGLVAIYVNKERLGKVHFHTNHAYFGLASIFVFFLQVLFGCFVGYSPRRWLQRVGHARILRIHRVAGYVSIALLWSTLWLAALTNWMVKNFNYPYLFALGASMASVGLIGQITPSRLIAQSRKQPLQQRT